MCNNAQILYIAPRCAHIPPLEKSINAYIYIYIYYGFFLKFLEISNFFHIFAHAYPYTSHGQFFQKNSKQNEKVPDFSGTFSSRPSQVCNNENFCAILYINRCFIPQN